MALKLSNNTYSTLAAGITASDVAMTVSAGTGTTFPEVVAPDIAYITLVRAASGAIEIVKCTAHVAGTDTFTIVRAQDGTTALLFVAGDKVSMRMCRAAFEAVAKLKWRGAYAAGTANYAVNDMVSDVGSSYVYINAASVAGKTPATEPTYWEVVAEKGATGAGASIDLDQYRIAGRYSALNGPYEQLTLHTNLTMSPAGELNVGANVPKKDTVGVFSKTQSVTPVALTVSGAGPYTIETVASGSNIFTHTMTNDATLSAPSALVAGTTYLWEFTQHASAAKTLAFASAFKFPGGVDGVISTGGGAKDLLSCVCTDGTNLLCAYSKAFS